MVAEAPAARAPLQLKVGAAYETVPVVAVALLLYVAAVRTFERLSVNVAGFAAVHAAVPVFVTVTVYVTTSPGLTNALFAVFTNFSAHADGGALMLKVAAPEELPVGPSVVPDGVVVTAVAVFGAVVPDATQVFGTVVLSQTC